MMTKKGASICMGYGLMLLMLITGCSSTAVGVRIKKAEKKPLEAVAYADGKVEAENVEFIYLDKGTRVDNVYIRLGDPVTEVQKLLQYDSDKIKNSSIDGVVTQINVRRGMVVDNDKPAIVIMDTRKLILKAYVKQSDSAGIQMGQEVSITADALPNRQKISGKVEEISQVAEQVEAQVYLPIWVRIDGQIPEALKAGMTVNCAIKLSRKENAITITYEAVKPVGEDSIVFVVKNNKLEERKVILGASSAITVEVKEGLSEGEDVVLDPRSDFKNGMAVTILSTEK